MCSRPGPCANPHPSPCARRDSFPPRFAVSAGRSTKCRQRYLIALQTIASAEGGRRGVVRKENEIASIRQHAKFYRAFPIHAAMAPGAHDRRPVRIQNPRDAPIPVLHTPVDGHAFLEVEASRSAGHDVAVRGRPSWERIDDLRPAESQIDTAPPPALADTFRSLPRAASKAIESSRSW